MILSRQYSSSDLSSLLCRLWLVIEQGLKLTTPPHWLPYYWWRYVNPNFSQTYDQSYDEQMFEMLPDWIKCIVIDKIKSCIESSNDGSDASNTSLLHNYTKAVKKVQASKKVEDNKTSKSAYSVSSDVIAHTCSTPLAHGISFTTCGGYDLNPSKAIRVSVPHIAQLSVLKHQWATLPIPGCLVLMAYVLASYSNINQGLKDFSMDSKLGTMGDADDDAERPSMVDRCVGN
jgi:hypothetical protein